MSTEPTPMYYKRRSEFVMRVVAGETVLVPVRQNLGDLEAIYTLNEVGTFIWQHLTEPIAENELTKAVEEEFDGDPTTIQKDVREFLGELIAVRAVTGAETMQT